MHLILKLMIISLLVSNALAKVDKYCYFTKHRKICYVEFKNYDKLRKPEKGERYFTSPDGNIYKFTDEIIVSLKYEGAILDLLENYDVEVVDKKGYSSYILRVKNKLLEDVSSFKNEVFDIKADIDTIIRTLSIVNNLDSVKYAKPSLKRKYRKTYKRAAAPKQEKVQKKSTSGSAAGASSISGAFN